MWDEQQVGCVWDKLGYKWQILKEIDSITTDWWIHSFKMVGASVTTREIIDKSLPRSHIVSERDTRQLPMALLRDIRVHPSLENRGLGTLLLQAIVRDCKQHGHNGLEGDLSETDRDHFDKLAYWYPKNGFSIEFYDEEKTKTINKPGRVWMKFDQD